MTYNYQLIDGPKHLEKVQYEEAQKVIPAEGGEYRLSGDVHVKDPANTPPHIDEKFQLMAWHPSDV